jgi:hypothetical protein
MSPMQRYQALNEQVLRLRRGRPLQLDIQGREHLRALHQDVMLESAATSLQIHLQVSQDNAARVYNASKVLAAPMVAACANAPYFYGKDLWDETRIPLFEQAVSVGTGERHANERVCFGKYYVRESLLECFQTNLEEFEVLLPMVRDEPPEAMAHLRLHNGTIWRWNRPLIGLDVNGVPHLRVEHRVVSAPTSVADTVANAALYFGLVQTLSTRPAALEARLSCDQARQNFYAAAKRGLDAKVTWSDGSGPLYELLRTQLLPQAREGLHALELDPGDIDDYLGIIAQRLGRRQNGAIWQRAFVARHGPDMARLTHAYRRHQLKGRPVHEWPVEPLE